MARPFRVGDQVRVSAHGTSKEAASPNGRSLAVTFDGGLFWPGDEGAYAGMMPLLQLDDGRFVELLNQREVQIELLTEDTDE